MYDCIIVGAGPAGGAAAYQLAKQGRSVLILEKAAMPRYKPCGGGVSPQIAKWFDFDFSPVVTLKIDALRFTFKGEDTVDTKLSVPEPIWVVDRGEFDAYLVKQAQQRGAELRDATAVQGIQWLGDRWQVNSSEGPLEAKYLIAADGTNGPMAKWLGFKGQKLREAIALEAPTPPPANAPIHFEFGMVKNGYIWSFPKPNGWSMGAATFRGGEGVDLKTPLTKYATALGIDVNTAQYHQHSLCLWDGDQKLHAQNALIVGEAAGIVDPMSAEGIRPSIYTGIKAAEAIDQALSGNPNALANYSETVAREWGADMAWAQKLAGVFYRVPGVAYKVGLKRPSVAERVGQILSGELRYSDVANRAIKRLTTGLIPGMGG
jgi:geranylgeranyl reductase family protein